MQELHGIGKFTRGTESLGHAFTMFRAGLRRNVLACLVFGLVGGTLSMVGDLPPGGLGALPTAIALDFAAAVDPDFVGTVTFPSGIEKRLPNHRAAAIFAQFFDGRPGGFILRQWLLRVLAIALFCFPVLVVALVAYGDRLTQMQTLRGTHLVDTTDPAHQSQQKRSRNLVIGAAAFLAAAVCLVSQVGFAGLSVLPLLVMATLADAFPPLAQLMSPGWDGLAMWASTPTHSGLLSPGDAVALAQHTLGRSLIGPAVVTTLAATLGGATAYALHRLHKSEAPGDLELGGLRIPRAREVYHWLISGVTGAGKSVALFHLLDQIRARGQRAIVFDRKGEFIEHYYDEKRGDIILNPLDARTAHWTPWGDIQNPADYLALGKSLFAEDVSRDKFWSVAGASLFASIVEHAQGGGYATNSELAEKLTRATLADVKDAIAGSVGERFLDEDASAMSASLLATLAAHLEAFTFLPNLPSGQEPFSIKDYIRAEDSEGWLFISMSAAHEKAIRPLVSMWYDLAIDAVLSLPSQPHSLPQAQRRRIWAVLDEVASLQALPALPAGLREGRSKGLACILGLQSMGDMRAAYGRDRAESILGQPQTRLILRTPEPDTAAWLERLLGKSERVSTQESQSMGANSQRDGVNLQRQKREESIVLAGEIQNLPDLTGFMKLPTGPVHKVAYTWTHRVISSPAFVPHAASEDPPRRTESPSPAKIVTEGASPSPPVVLPAPSTDTVVAAQDEPKDDDDDDDYLAFLS